MDKYKFFIVFTVSLIVLLPLTALAQEPPPVKIGFLYPMSGAQAAVGREALRGAQIAADMVNESGGIWNRRKIEFVIGDGKALHGGEGKGYSRRLRKRPRLCGSSCGE